MTHTVNKQALLNEAASIEASAKNNLNAWCILGQSEKYGQALEQAAKLRKAADMGVAARRAYLVAQGLA